MKECDIGLIGLAVMGQNLVLNMNDKGFKVAVYNRTTSKVTDFLEGPAKGTNVEGFVNFKDFFAALKRPRKVMMMVKAGAAVDALIEECLPYLEKGDIIIDGGNSLFTDSERRVAYLEKKGISFIGAGISGGEEGARHGPSIMPGGQEDAWPHVKPIFQSIAAKVDGTACCDWVGHGGSGHFVKMVHNGIEYADMQLIAEIYHVLKMQGLSPDHMGDLFQKWNQGKLNSYLIEITAQILKYKENGKPIIDFILDAAGQKGTGKWTVVAALDAGVSCSSIAEAVFARCISSFKELRVKAQKELGLKLDLEALDPLDEKVLESALYIAKLITYAQGFMLMKESAKENKWALNYGSIAMLWRGGCIIRSHFLGKIKEAFDKNPQLECLLLDPYFKKEVQDNLLGLRKTAASTAMAGIPAPALSSSLSFFDSFASGFLPANLIQAQRDFFGAHTYERLDKPRGEFFHTNWTGSGGNITASSYNV
jgi:6-phosphogluconate dehydrogenase